MENLEGDINGLPWIIHLVEDVVDSNVGVFNGINIRANNNGLRAQGQIEGLVLFFQAVH